jgi:hypothetical protein
MATTERSKRRHRCQSRREQVFGTPVMEACSDDEQDNNGYDPQHMKPR